MIAIVSEVKSRQATVWLQMDRLSNARHGAGDGHGGQTTATIERRNFNTRHGVGDGDGGQTAATIERPFINTPHGILQTFIFYTFWNN